MRRTSPEYGRRVTVRAVAAVLAVAVVVGSFAFGLPALAHYGAVWPELHSLTDLWLAALLAAVLANALTSALPWSVMLPRLGLLSALRITQASTALINVLPGGAPAGMAASFTLLRSRGVGTEEAATTIGLTGIWSQLSTCLFPVVAVAALAGSGELSGPLLLAAATGLALTLVAAAVVGFAVTSRRRTLVLGLGLRRATARILPLVRRRPPRWTRTSILRLRRNTLRTVRRSGLALTTATLANQLTGFLVFDLTLRALGITVDQVSLAESFTAWSLARLIESLPLTPGGLGVVELGLTGTLLGFGAPRAPVLAAVLLYRALTVLPTLTMGAAAGLTWKLRWSTARAWPTPR